MAQLPMTSQRIKHTPESIAEALKSLGLKEEERPCSGYAFTRYKKPHDAMSFYAETHGGAEPRRFYIGIRTYTLSD